MPLEGSVLSSMALLNQLSCMVWGLQVILLLGKEEKTVERLDRVLVNDPWMSAFPNFLVSHLPGLS